MNAQIDSLLRQADEIEADGRRRAAALRATARELAAAGRGPETAKERYAQPDGRALTPHKIRALLRRQNVTCTADLVRLTGLPAKELDRAIKGHELEASVESKCRLEIAKLTGLDYAAVWGVQLPY